MGSYISWPYFLREGEEVEGLLESLLVCKYLQQGRDGKEAPIGAWAISHG